MTGDDGDPWAELFRETVPPASVRLRWFGELARNEGAPAEVLVRLVGRTDALVHRAGLPDEVIDALIDHPRGRISTMFEIWRPEQRPVLSPEQWTRLLTKRVDRGGGLVALAAECGATLTAAGYERLATAPSAAVRREAVYLPGMPEQWRHALLDDEDPEVRAAAAWYSDALAQEEPPEDYVVSREDFDREGPSSWLLSTYRLDRELAEHLVRSEDVELRRAAVSNPWLDADLVAELARDAEYRVRWEACLHPALDEEVRDTVDVEIDPEAGRDTVATIRALHDDPRAMRRLARSRNVLVRSEVARARHLPTDVVAALARDEDRVVQLFLTESCQDATRDVLLSVWKWWPGFLGHPGPHRHRNFPTTDLVRYADDPSPRMRQLVPTDPEATGELIERLAHDPEDTVRAAAAKDRRLRRETAESLLADPSAAVRRAVRRNPGLPADLLARLVQAPGAECDEVSAGVAGNPALPVAVMHRMIDLAEAAEAEAAAEAGAAEAAGTA